MRSSIINNDRRCFVCGTESGLHKHHVFFGTRNRSKADKDGLVVYLCYQHHEGTNGIHGKNGHNLDLLLKRKAEECWIKHYNKTESDFIERYGKNYL